MKWSIKELANILNVSRPTIRDAVEKLELTEDEYYKNTKFYYAVKCLMIANYVNRRTKNDENKDFSMIFIDEKMTGKTEIDEINGKKEFESLEKTNESFESLEENREKLEEKAKSFEESFEKFENTILKPLKDELTAVKNDYSALQLDYNLLKDEKLKIEKDLAVAVAKYEEQQKLIQRLEQELNDSKVLTASLTTINGYVSKNITQKKMGFFKRLFVKDTPTEEV